MNIQARNINTYLPNASTVKKSSSIKNKFITVDKNIVSEVKNEKVDVKNATYKEVSNVLNQISREQGDGGLRFDLDLTHVIESISRFLNSPRNPNPSLKLVIEGNPMFEGYGGVKSNWIELYERKANQQLKLGNRSGYERFMKSSNDLRKYYEKNINNKNIGYVDN